MVLECVSAGILKKRRWGKMDKYILEVAKTRAHLHKYLETMKDYNFTGFSFPYVNAVDKELANRICKLLNYEDCQFIEKEMKT